MERYLPASACTRDFFRLWLRYCNLRCPAGSGCALGLLPCLTRPIGVFALGKSCRSGGDKACKAAVAVIVAHLARAMAKEPSAP